MDTDSEIDLRYSASAGINEVLQLGTQMLS